MSGTFKVKDLKRILREIPDDADILLSVCGYDLYCGTTSHGGPEITLCKDRNTGNNIFTLSAGSGYLFKYNLIEGWKKKSDYEINKWLDIVKVFQHTDRERIGK